MIMKGLTSLYSDHHKTNAKNTYKEVLKVLELSVITPFKNKIKVFVNCKRFCFVSIVLLDV